MTADLTEQRVRELIREELAARSFFSVEPRDSISEQLHRVKLLINSGRQSLDRIREDLKALREGLKADASRFEFDERRYGVSQKLGGVDTVAAEQQPPRTLDKPGRDGEPAGIDVAHDQLAEAFDVHDSSPSLGTADALSVGDGPVTGGDPAGPGHPKLSTAGPTFNDLARLLAVIGDVPVGEFLYGLFLDLTDGVDAALGGAS